MNRITKEGECIGRPASRADAMMLQSWLRSPERSRALDVTSSPWTGGLPDSRNVRASGRRTRLTVAGPCGHLHPASLALAASVYGCNMQNPGARPQLRVWALGSYNVLWTVRYNRVDVQELGGHRARRRPVAKTTSASVRRLRRRRTRRTSTIDTSERIELVDLTDTVMAFVRRSACRKGCCRSGRCTPPARCSSTNRRRRSRPTSRRSSRTSWRATAITCTTIPIIRIAIAQNADSHLRAMLLGHSVTMQISGGEAGARAVAARVDAASWMARGRGRIRAQVMGLA